MRRTSLILLLTLLLAFISCSRENFSGSAVQQEPELGIYLAYPVSATKADVGDIPATEVEYALHSLRIWVFTSEGHELVSHLNLNASQFPSEGRVRRYAVPVSRDFAHNRPDVDVFALANAASVGCTLNENASWEEVNDAAFGADWFGVATPVRSVNPQKGLPVTGVGKGLEIQGDEPILKIQTVQLKRAVSKLRYVFCRMYDEDENDDISVDYIILNGALIPVSEYLFTENACAIAPGGYEAEPLTTEGPATLAQNETPERLVYAGQDAVSYENLLNDAVEEGILTDAGVIYLRESDKALSGSVRYTVNGVSHTRNFSMERPGDFTRNHSWTLYGYFLSGRNLQLSTNVLPWDYNSHNINFSDQSVQTSQFAIDDTSAEITETSQDNFNVRLRAGVPVKCHFYITTPVSGKLMIQPKGDVGAFIVTPDMADINPNFNSGRVDIEVRRNPDAEGDLTGRYITLSFSVELGEREIDANSEILNGKVYRFVL